MSDLVWSDFEATVVRFCEVRAEYRRRKSVGALDREQEQTFLQALDALEVQIEHLRNGDELALARYGTEAQRAENLKSWRIAQ